jgi:hypothetical protein
MERFEWFEWIQQRISAKWMLVAVHLHHGTIDTGKSLYYVCMPYTLQQRKKAAGFGEVWRGARDLDTN